MTRSILTTYFFVPLLAVTFVIAWIGFSSSNPSSQTVRSMEPAQHMQSAPAIFNSESVVRLVHHGPNHPPVVNSPVEDRSRVVLFPMGPAAVLEFEGEPATDHEEDILTYRFGIAVPGKLGVRSPAEALLQVTRLDNRFFIEPCEDISPAEFVSVYGNVGTIPVLPAVIYANDGKSESKPEFFNLTLVYDASIQFSAPSESIGKYHRETHEPADRYEGASDSMDGANTNTLLITDAFSGWRLDPPSPYVKTVRTIQTTK